MSGTSKRRSPGFHGLSVCVCVCLFRPIVFFLNPRLCWSLSFWWQVSFCFYSICHIFVFLGASCQISPHLIQSSPFCNCLRKEKTWRSRTPTVMSWTCHHRGITSRYLHFAVFPLFHSMCMLLCDPTVADCFYVDLRGECHWVNIFFFFWPAFESEASWVQLACFGYFWTRNHFHSVKQGDPSCLADQTQMGALDLCRPVVAQ